MLASGHRALGLADGITHTEVRMTAQGPVIIEVNARLGGDMIPYLGKLATGVDPGQVAANAARGAHPRLEVSRHQVAGIRFLYPPEDCRIVDISLPEPGAVPGLVSAQPMAAPGEAVYLPPRAHLGRYALLVACTTHPATCEACLDEAAMLASVQFEPLKPESTRPAAAVTGTRHPGIGLDSRAMLSHAVASHVACYLVQRAAIWTMSC